MKTNSIIISMRTSERTYVSIADWQAMQCAIQEGALETQFLISRIVLTQNDKDVFALEDCFEPMLRDLLLHAPQKLLLRQDYIFGNWDYPGSIQIKLSDEDVNVTGDFQSSSTWDRKVLTTLLLQGAELGMSLMRKLHVLDTGYNYAAYEYFASIYADASARYAAQFGNLPNAIPGIA